MPLSTTTARRLLAATFAVGAACAKLPQAAAQDAAGVQVRFGDDCGSAVVTTAQRVATLITVFNDSRSENVGELPRAASYVLRVAPAALESGLAINALYVHSAEPVAGRATAVSHFECATHARRPVRGRDLAAATGRR